VSKYYPFTTGCVLCGLEIEKGRKKGRETRKRIGPRVGSSDEPDRVYAGNVSGACTKQKGKTGWSALFMTTLFDAEGDGVREGWTAENGLCTYILSGPRY
jgi:hypothetical protein